jgi:hypothetical protein
MIDSVDFLSKAVEIYTDDGRFSIAAKHEKDMAEALESEVSAITITRVQSCDYK